MWFEKMHSSWQTALADQRNLLDSLEVQLARLQDLAPEASKVMAAFEADPRQTKVVILGQDPYPTPGAAIGHAFAVSNGSKMPASLKNIEAELKIDLSAQLSDPELSKWRGQGVWLLNTSLTTLANQPGAHSNSGWQRFTLAALNNLAAQQPLVILAWGIPARKLVKQLAGGQIRVVESAHPSPLSANRGFLGSKPFSRANFELQKLGLSPIDW